MLLINLSLKLLIFQRKIMFYDILKLQLQFKYIKNSSLPILKLGYTRGDIYFTLLLHLLRLLLFELFRRMRRNVIHLTATYVDTFAYWIVPQNDEKCYTINCYICWDFYLLNCSSEWRHGQSRKIRSSNRTRIRRVRPRGRAPGRGHRFNHHESSG